MNKPRNTRVLAVALSMRGFGFAVLEEGKLVDWGVKNVKGDKNVASLKKIGGLLDDYHPGMVVLEDFSVAQCRRSARIRELGERIVEFSGIRKVRVKRFSRKQVMRTLFGDDSGTKDELTRLLAKRYPEELAFRLPPKRRPWMSEDYRMGIFEAVALALMVASS